MSYVLQVKTVYYTKLRIDVIYNVVILYTYSTICRCMRHLNFRCYPNVSADVLNGLFQVSWWTIETWFSFLNLFLSIINYLLYIDITTYLELKSVCMYL